MANCFENFIGIRCVSQTPPVSGLYIDDLEGLNLKFAANTADANYLSGVQFIERKIAFATQLVLNDVSKYAAPYFRLNSIVSEMRAGEFTTTFVAPEAFNKGLKIETRESRMLRIRIPKIEVKIQEPMLLHSLSIVDGLNVTYYPFTTNGNGEATIYPNYLSQTELVYIVMDNAAINPNETEVKGGCKCFSKKTEFLVANGWDGSNVASTSFGISADVLAECAQTELACILANELRFAILYRSGLEIVKEAKTTGRLNSVTLLDEEKIAFLLAEFERRYTEEMKNTVETLPVLLSRLDDICIVCSQSRYVFGTP